MSKSQVRFFQQNVQMLQIASDMMLFFASLIFQEAGRDLYLYSSSWKSLFPLPCTGFNRNGQKEVPQFPTLYLYSHIWCCWSSRVLFSSVHLKTPQVEEMSVVRFSHLIQAHKALVHGVSYGIHDHTVLECMAPSRGQNSTSLRQILLCVLPPDLWGVEAFTRWMGQCIGS